MKKLPKFLITIDDEYSEGENLGIDQIAFTSTPAIITKGFAFKSELKKVSFVDDLKYRIAAPAMIPMEIYRNDDSEYYVEFTSEEIEKIHSKFMSNLNNQNMFNLEHDSAVTVPAYVLEAILVDSESKIEMIKQEYNIDVPMGTSFLVTQITDKQYYNELVDNGQTGYSIEGFLGLRLSEHINNKKQKLNKMNETKSMLPAGEYTDKEGNIFIVAEDGTISTKEVELSSDVKKEEMGLEVAPEAKAQPEVSGTTETKLEEVLEDTETEIEMAIEEVAVEAPVEVAPIETYSKVEVDAKLDEIYKILADMQAEDDTEDVLEGPEEIAMSLHDKFAAFTRFSKE
jgi:hypothetical protein